MNALCQTQNENWWTILCMLSGGQKARAFALCRLSVAAMGHSVQQHTHTQTHTRYDPWDWMCSGERRNEFTLVSKDYSTVSQASTVQCAARTNTQTVGVCCFQLLKWLLLFYIVLTKPRAIKWSVVCRSGCTNVLTLIVRLFDFRSEINRK